MGKCNEIYNLHSSLHNVKCDWMKKNGVGRWNEWEKWENKYNYSLKFLREKILGGPRRKWEIILEWALEKQGSGSRESAHCSEHWIAYKW